MGFSELKRVQDIGSIGDYYVEGTTTTLYVNKPFNSNVNKITVCNDSSSDSIQVSFDAATLAFNIMSGESVDITTRNKSSIYIKSTLGSAAYRIKGW